MRAFATTLLLLGLLATSFGCGGGGTGTGGTGGEGGAPSMTSSSSTGSTSGSGGSGGGSPCVPVDDQNPCTDDVCEGDLPVHHPVAEGTVLQVQIAGDCKKDVCDGMGAALAENDDADLPLDDSNACTDEVCNAGVPGHLAKVCGAGTSCIGGACVAPCGGVPGFPGMPLVHTGANPSDIAAADLNGDGKPDLAVANDGGAGVSVLLNTGNGTFAAKVDYATGTKPSSVVAADLNGDGKPDLAVANSGSATVSVLFNIGNGKLSAKVDYFTSSSPGSVVALDLDGDGKPDLATASSGLAGGVSVLINNGNGSFAAKVDYPTGSVSSSVVAADLDSDGKPDLAVTNYLSNTVSVLLNAGNGIFPARLDYPSVHAYAIAAADLDGDGKLDLAVTDASILVSVLINTCVP